MPVKVRDMRRMLVRKLQADEKEGSKHIKYRISNEGKLLATTALSRSYDEIDNSLLSSIGKQLFVDMEQLNSLLDCSFSRDDYVTHVSGDG